MIRKEQENYLLMKRRQRRIKTATINKREANTSFPEKLTGGIYVITILIVGRHKVSGKFFRLSINKRKTDT